LAEEQRLKFSIKVVNINSRKCYTICRVRFASSLCNVQLQLPVAQAQTKTLYSLFNKLA